MILVTTAGKVGSEAARQLAQSGEQVRVLARSAEKATLAAGQVRWAGEGGRELGIFGNGGE